MCLESVSRNSTDRFVLIVGTVTVIAVFFTLLVAIYTHTDVVSFFLPICYWGGGGLFIFQHVSW